MTSSAIRRTEVSFFSNFVCLSRNIFVCKFVYIFRTDENPFGSCQPCSNNIHITYDDNTAAHRATCDFNEKKLLTAVLVVSCRHSISRIAQSVLATLTTIHFFEISEWSTHDTMSYSDAPRKT